MEHLAPAAAPAWLQAIEASALAQLLRSSLWLYPAVETLHILGMAVLVGAIAVFDLRLVLAPPAAAGAPAELAAWGRTVLPVARAGFALALPMGLLLFAVEATAYAANPAFRLKLVLLVLALANVALFHALAARLRPPSPGAIRVLAAASLLLWTGVLVCGRLIAYL